MTNRCSDCITPDSCNFSGCVNPPNYCFAFCHETCQNGCNYSEGDGSNYNDKCCGDPSDCNEACAYHNEDPIDVGEIKLDGRNEGPVNKFGCSYVDCSCTRPCWSEPDSKIVNITINGDNYGDIKV